MSLDLVILTHGSAPDYDHARRVSCQTEAGEPDAARIGSFAEELDRTFGERNWPFTGDPIVTPSHVELVIAHEVWEEVVPAIVAMAHRHDLVALDPQWERLFPPGTDYELDVADEVVEPASKQMRLEMTVHWPDGTSEDAGVVYDTSRWWRWGPGRITSWIRVARLNLRKALRDR